MRPKISVIVPVYNVEQYVERCVDSITGQSYSNLEIILVNDGSTDSSASICEKMSVNDERVIIVNKKNGGLSDARNYGLERCSGEYVVFIDSDDYITPDCIERLYDNLARTGSDIATVLFAPFGEGDTPNCKKGHNRVLSTEKALEYLLYQKHCTTSAWGKLYKKELFGNIRYPVGKVCEDLPVTYKLFANAKKVAIDDSRLYCYLQRKNSIIRSNFKPARFEALEFAKEETIFISNNWPKIKKAAYNREFMEAIYIQECILGSSHINEKYYDKAEEVRRALRSTILFDVKAPVKSKLYALLGAKKIANIRRTKNV